MAGGLMDLLWEAMIEAGWHYDVRTNGFYREDGLWVDFGQAEQAWRDAQAGVNRSVSPHLMLDHMYPEGRRYEDRPEADDNEPPPQAG